MRIMCATINQVRVERREGRAIEPFAKGSGRVNVCERWKTRATASEEQDKDIGDRRIPASRFVVSVAQALTIRS